MSNFVNHHQRRYAARSRFFAAAVAVLAFAGNQPASANSTIKKGTTAADCAACHVDDNYSYDNLHPQIKALAATGVGNDAWIAAINACGSSVFGANGSCTTTPPPPNNQPPVVSVTPPPAVVAPAAVSFTVAVSDPDGDAVTVAASGSLNGTDASTLYDDATRTFKWDPSVAGSYSVTFTPTDAKGLAGAAATVQITVDPPSSGGGNDAPVITQPSDGSTLNAVTGVALTIPVAATDKNGDPVKLSYTATDGSNGSIPVTFDPASGAWSGSLQWTPAAGVTTVGFTFTATDVPSDTTVTPKSSSVSVTVNVSDNGGGTGGGDVTAVNISRAYWSDRGHRLFAAGTVTAAEGVKLKGMEVTVSDADTGEVIGTAKVKRRGVWKLKKRLDTAPCSITASVGEVSSSQDVSRATGCDGGSSESDDHGGEHHDGDDDHRREHKDD